MKHIVFLIPLSLLLSACCCCSTRDGQWVSQEIECRTGYDVSWHRTCLLEQQAQAHMEALLSFDITADEAVQIALLNNPSVQIQFETIGIRRAEYLAAILPRNPIAYWEVRREHNPFSPKLDIEWSITGFLWDIFLIPLKKKAALIALRQEQLNVAQSILDLTLQVKTTYYQLQAAEEKLDLILFHLHEAELALNSTRTPTLSDETRYRETVVQLYKADLNVKELKEKLNQLMGLESSPDSWDITLELPAEDPHDISLDTALNAALHHRLELQHDRWAVYGLLQQAKLQDWWTFLDPQVGPAQEFNPDYTIETGATGTFNFPLFNWGQASRKHIFYEVRQLWRQYQNTRIEILAAVRLAFARMERYREMLEIYEQDILPLVDANRRPKSDIDSVVLDRIDTLEEQYGDLLRSYWIHRAELEHAVGGSLILQEC